MKNFIFKSSLDKDLLKILKTLDIIQAEQRHARYDLQQIEKKLDVTVKGIALLVSAPEPDLDLNNGGENGTNQDNRDGD